MDDYSRLEEKLYQHCIGAGNPVGELARSGRLPANWASRYEALLNKASHAWGRADVVPRRVAAAVHYASMHVCGYYDLWSALNGRHDEATRESLRRVRASSEVFLQTGINGTEPAPPPDGAPRPA